MINRLKLPREDEFLETANNDHADLFKQKEPATPRKCECDYCPSISFAGLMTGAFLTDIWIP